jgi:hypothetical protein
MLRYFLTGRITATSTARTSIFFPVIGRPMNLAGRVTATVTAWASQDYPTVKLSGRITSTARASFLSINFINVAGLITSTTRARLRSIPILVLSGRVTAATRAYFRWIGLNLVGGRLNIAVKATHAGFPFHHLMGRIKSTTSARLDFPALIGQVSLAGRIKSTTSARLVGDYMVWVGGRVKTTSTARLDFPGLQTFLTGGQFVGFAGPSVSTRMFGLFNPNFDLLASRIKITLRVSIDVAELYPPRPDIPVAFPVFTTDYYLGYITSEHNQRPKYMQTVSITVEPMVDDAYLAASLPVLFDLDYSVGEQEDFTGQWIGKNRWIQMPMGFFSWDTPSLGWDEANWQGPFDAANYIQRLDDYHYRMLLYAAIIANHWDGSVPKAYEAWDTLLSYTGLRVIIQDYGNMTMLYGLLWTEKPSTVLLGLFTTGQMDLKPEGIELLDYVFPPSASTPLFAWDAESDSVAGWDVGEWGILVPPGTGFVPI